LSRVCVIRVKNQDVYETLKTYFGEIVSDGLFNSRRKVLIKPNFVNSLPATSGVTTDFRIITSLIKILREKGVKEVIVGESSLEDTDKVFKTLNVFELEKFGAKVMNFDREKWVKVESSLGLALKRFYIAKAVLDCDLVISVAKMKTHMETKVTLSVKNVLGMISRRDRKVAHMIDIDGAIVDVFAYLKANKKLISFVDGIYALEGRRGPTAGRPVKMDLIVAGDDAVAVDAACVEIMGYDAKRVKHLTLSEKFGLGEMGNREIIGEAIEDVKREFEMPPAIPSFKSYLLSYAMNEFFKKTSYLRFEERCTGCKTCVENCPIGNIVLENGKVKMNKKKCIGCMICIESCKEGALDYKINHERIYKIGRKIYHKVGITNDKEKHE